MAVSFYKIKKWTNMLLGKSVHHVNQGPGQVYSVTEVKGYYNDLTEKVTRFGFEDNRIPKTTVDSGEEIYFSIAVFQYGIGAYDLYLKNDDEAMLKKTIATADWAVENQQQDGSFITFDYKNKKQPYSAMAQGEAISLLIRAHIATGDEKYLTAAKKAKDFMLIPIGDGGTTEYVGNDVYLYECTFFKVILNGWIFALWGLWDYCKYFDDEKVKSVLDATIKSLQNKLPDFDLGYWSRYEDSNRICSSFYHSLHIAQLNTMYDLTGIQTFKEYAEKWQKNKNSFICSKRAFIKKAIQKVLEK